MDIGIIGGADGPTKIFLSSRISPYTILIIIVIVVVGIILIYKRRK